MTKIIGFVNQKGGVAKTTCALNLAYGLALRKKKVLVIDFDPQGNLTAAMGADLEDGEPSVASWILGKNTFEETVKTVKNIDVIPTNIALANVEMELQNRIAREQTLLRAISKASGIQNYDFIIIDSNPSLGVMTLNVLCACDEIVVPLKAEFFSYDGVISLLDTVDTVREAGINPDLKVNGFLITMADLRRNSLKEKRDAVVELGKEKNIHVYDAMIKQLTDYAEAPDHRMSIFEYKPNSDASKNFNEFIDEFLKNN